MKTVEVRFKKVIRTAQLAAAFLVLVISSQAFAGSAEKPTLRQKWLGEIAEALTRSKENLPGGCRLTELKFDSVKNVLKLKIEKDCKVGTSEKCSGSIELSVISKEKKPNTELTLQRESMANKTNKTYLYHEKILRSDIESIDQGIGGQLFVKSIDGKIHPTAFSHQLDFEIQFVDPKKVKLIRIGESTPAFMPEGLKFVSDKAKSFDCAPKEQSFASALNL